VALNVVRCCLLCGDVADHFDVEIGSAAPADLCAYHAANLTNADAARRAAAGRKAAVTRRFRRAQLTVLDGGCDD
jgi:hypothetical protein